MQAFGPLIGCHASFYDSRMLPAGMAALDSALPSAELQNLIWTVLPLVSLQVRPSQPSTHSYWQHKLLFAFCCTQPTAMLLTFVHDVARFKHVQCSIMSALMSFTLQDAGAMHRIWQQLPAPADRYAKCATSAVTFGHQLPVDISRHSIPDCQVGSSCT